MELLFWGVEGTLNVVELCCWRLGPSSRVPRVLDVVTLVILIAFDILILEEQGTRGQEIGDPILKLPLTE